MEIDISHESVGMVQRAPVEVVESVLAKVLAIVGKRKCELSCSFVSDETMRELNHTYRQKDESTDILSFVQSDDDDEFAFTPDEGEPEVLGDIVISLDAMERNCEAFGVTSEEELRRLLIHGVLHLTGWDHQTNDADEPMLVKQEALLKILEKESIA